MAGLVPFNRRRYDLPSTNLFNMMDDFFHDDWPLSRNLMSCTFKTDVQETGSEYIIEAEMPGVQKGEIDLSMDDSKLTIRVERNTEIKNDGDHYIHRERCFSSMQRSIFLADAGDESINANLCDGILKIIVPKRVTPSPARRIEIK